MRLGPIDVVSAGRAIRQLKIPREKLFIATKFALQFDPVMQGYSVNCKPGNNCILRSMTSSFPSIMFTADYVKSAIEASLKRLQMPCKPYEVSLLTLHSNQCSEFFLPAQALPEHQPDHTVFGIREI
jgi:hypothetical protein